MSISTWLRRLAAAACLAAAPLAACAAEAPPRVFVTDPVYTVELRSFLNYTRVYERLMDAMRHAPRPDDPFERELLDAFLASLTADQFYAKAIPVYAKYVPPKHAATLGAMAKKRPVPLGTQQAALQSFWGAEKASAAEMREVGRQLGIEFGQRIQQKASAEIRRAIADMAAHRGTQYTVQINRIGLPFMDRIVSLGVNHVIKQSNATMVAENECKAAGGVDTLRPASLLATDGLAAARFAIDGCEHALEQLEKSSDAAFNEFHDGVLALNFPARAGIAQTLEKVARNNYDFALKYGELNRQNLQARRRLVDLVEARRAHIYLENGKAMFESADDLAEFNRIVAEMLQAEKSANDFVYEARQKSQLRDIDLHDGITAPQDAGSTN